MGLLASFDRSIRASADDPAFSDAWYDGSYSSDPSMIGANGGTVTEIGAIKNPTFWACLLWRYKMFGMLPRTVNEHAILLGESSQVEAPDHPLYALLNESPNPAGTTPMTAFDFFGSISADRHCFGNSYAYILRDGRGVIIALVRISPDKVHPKIKSVGGGPRRLWYEVDGDNGVPVNFYPDEILHTKGFSFDGIEGVKPVRLAMQNELGWSMAAVRNSKQFLNNASRPSGIITMDSAMKPEVKTGVVEALKATGRDVGKLVLIENALNVKFQKMTLDADEAQYIETLAAQEKRCCSMMEVKPFEVGIMDQMTNNNIEQETISSVTRNLQPLDESVVQQMEMQLFSTAPSTGRGGGTERQRFFISTEFKILLKGDTAAQTAHIVAMRDRAIYSGNQCARYLGEQPFEGGDIRVMNAAYVPLDELRALAKARATATPPGAPNTSGGPVPTDNKASISQMFGGLFRACVGKTIARKKDREKSADGIFRDLIQAVSAALNVTDFDVDDYLGALAKRSTGWTEARADAIAEEELTRLVAALMERR